MADEVMECCFCKKKGSRIHLQTTRDEADPNVANFFANGLKAHNSADCTPVEIVEIVRRTIWVEKGSKGELRDLVDSLVNSIEVSHKERTGVDQGSGPKMPDRAGVDSQKLEITPLMKASKSNKNLHEDFCKESSSAPDGTATELDKILSRGYQPVKQKQSNNEYCTLGCEDNTPPADKLCKDLEVDDVACINSTYSEPSTPMAARRSKLNENLSSSGQEIHDGSVTEPEDVGFDLPQSIKIRKATEIQFLDCDVEIHDERNTPLSPADGSSKGVDSIGDAGVKSLPLKAREKSRKNRVVGDARVKSISFGCSIKSREKSRKSRLVKIGVQRAQELNCFTADGIFSNSDDVASSVEGCTELPSIVRTKRTKKHCSSSSRGENVRKTRASNENATNLDDVVSSVANSVELLLPFVLEEDHLVSSSTKKARNMDIVAADGTMSEPEENICEYSSPSESLPCSPIVKSKKVRFSDGGENARKRNGCAAGKTVHEHVVADSSQFYQSPRPVRVKKHKKCQSKSTGESFQRRKNPALDDFIREYKKDFACSNQKLLDSPHLGHVTKHKKKRHTGSGFMDNEKRILTDSASRLTTELDGPASDDVAKGLEGATRGYSDSFEFPRPLKKKSRKGGENADEERIIVADGVSIELDGVACRSSLELFQPSEAKESKLSLIPISSVENADESDGTAIDRDEYPCGNFKMCQSSPSHTKVVRKKIKQDGTGVYCHTRSFDAQDRTEKNLEISGACLDLVPLESQLRSSKELKNLRRDNRQGYANGDGEVSRVRKTATEGEEYIDVGNGVMDARSPTSRKKLKGCKKRHRRENGRSSDLDSDVEESQAFDFEEEDSPLFLVPSKQEKKKVRFFLPDQVEGDAAEENDEKTRRSWKYDHNMPDIKFGKFTQEEDEKIQKAINNYIEEREWDKAKGQEMLLNTGNHKEARGAWLDIAKCLRHRPVKLINARARRLLEGGNRGKWSEEEEEQLKTLLLQYGRAWNRIGRTLDRPAQVCKDKWRSLRLAPVLKKGPWSQEEQDQLQAHVLQSLEAKQKLSQKQVDRSQWRRKDVNWERIADMMRRRGRACAYVWYKKICPLLADGNSNRKPVKAISYPRSALKTQSSLN